MLDALYDIIIFVAGPTGLACGIELKQRGLRAVLFDKGCLTNSLYHYPTHMTFFRTPELLEIGNIPRTSMYDKPTRHEALKYHRRVAAHYKLDIHQYERVLGVEGEDNDFRVTTSLGHYCGRKTIVASGYYDVPNLLNVPGENLDKVIHYYKEAHPYYNHDVLVVGAKNSAAIAALELFWTGARVTLIHRGPGISDRVKYWIKPNIENRIKSGEIKAYFHSCVKEIHPDTLLIQTPSGEVSLQNDYVLALIGYSPDEEFLNSVGVTIDPITLRPETNPETLAIRTPGLH